MNFSTNEIILFQGDSITDGGRGKGETDPNHFIGHSYPYLIGAELSYKYIDKNPQIYSRGISGNDILQMYARWREDAINLNPTIVNILIGINDAGKWNNSNSGSSPGQYKNIMKMIIEETRSELKNTQFILCEPFYFADESNDISLKTYDDILVRQDIVKTIADEYNCIFVPLQKELEAYANKLGDRKKILWDGVHPTLLGHSIISKKWFEVTKL